MGNGRMSDFGKWWNQDVHVALAGSNVGVVPEWEEGSR